MRPVRTSVQEMQSAPGRLAREVRAQRAPRDALGHDPLEGREVDEAADGVRRAPRPPIVRASRREPEGAQRHADQIRRAGSSRTSRSRMPRQVSSEALRALAALRPVAVAAT